MLTSRASRVFASLRLGWGRYSLPVALAFMGAVACSGKFTTTGNEQVSVDGGATGGAMSGTGGAKSSGGSRATGGSRTSGGNTGVGGATGVGGTIGVSGAGGVVSTDASAGGGTGGVSTGGSGGTGGVGRTGGAPGTGGTNATGGAIATGGVNATGGAIGTGGVPVVCAAGDLACDDHQRCGNNGQWQSYTCGPLVATDVIKIDASNIPGFFNVGAPTYIRCKALVVCGVSQSCHYSAQVGTGNLGSVQSREDTYYDGLTLQDGQAVMVQIMVGAASQCGDPSITIAAGEYVLVGLASGRTVKVTFPAFTGTGLLLFVREDGATFYDDSLLQRAG